MVQPLDSGFDALFVRLASQGGLERSDVELLASLGWKRIEAEPRRKLHDRQAVTIIGSGWAARCRLMLSGRQQLVALHLAGDICDFNFITGPAQHISMIALTEVTAWTLPLADLVEVTEKRPPIMRAMLAALTVEKAICEEQLVTLGSRPALARLAHLICEIY